MLELIVMTLGTNQECSPAVHQVISKSESTQEISTACNPAHQAKFWTVGVQKWEIYIYIYKTPLYCQETLNSNHETCYHVYYESFSNFQAPRCVLNSDGLLPLSTRKSYTDI